IFLRGVQSFADLDPVSKLRFSAFFNRFFNHFEAMYFSHLDGILTASAWGKIERTMSDLIAYPGVQQWWEERRHWHTEEFGRVVDAIIAKGTEPKAYSTYNLRKIDMLEPQPDANAFHWTLTGPGGTGKKVRISGYELWKIDNDGLIGEAKGHFDSAEYECQLKHGVDG